MTSNFSNQKNRKIKTQYKHLLRLESLEERALLSAVPLSASEYADLRAQYADFNLPENMEDMNVITLDLAEGDGLTALQDAITTAGTTEKSDLIVVRTSETANTLTYTSDENELYIEIDANDFGSVTIVGWGVQNLMLDVDLQSNCGIEVFGETTIAKLGGLTITNAYNGISSFESDEVMVTHCNILSSDINGIASVYGTLTVTNSTISNTTEGCGIYKSEGTLTVTDCTISGNASYSGGGIWCYNADATVTDCLISNNSAIDSGGGIFFGGDYSSTITNCSIWGNSAREGGGIYIDRYTESEGSVTITDCTISDNVADSYGGGIYNFVDGVTITDCTISGNYGEGIVNYGTLTITDCTISGNDGTGIVNYGTLTITDCTISDAISDWLEGGISNSGMLTITNSLISGNSGIGISNSGMLTITNSLISGNSGGGIYNKPYYNDASTAVITLTNCTIAGNTSEYDGNGFYNDYLAEASVCNSIIIDSIVNDYGTISGSNNLSSFTNWDSSSNNIRYNSTKPLFVDAENGDYHLTTGSQAIDKGNNALAVDENEVALMYDLDGSLRVVNGRVDIGAYESQCLETPVLDTPTVDGTTVSVSWSKVENASGYQLEYKLSTDSEWEILTVLDTFATFECVADLTYQVRVKALGGEDHDDSAYSSVKVVGADPLNYGNIREAYSIFDLPDEDEINIIFVDLTAGENLMDLKNAIESAEETSEDDLIIVLTSDDANTLTFESSEDLLNFDFDTDEYGSVTIIGWGSQNFTLDANQLGSVMNVGYWATVNLGGLTITNAYVDWMDGSGIFNSGTLTIANSMFVGNYTNACGTIMNDEHGVLRITNTTFSGNTAVTSGGGIYNFGTLVVTDSIFSWNSSNAGGGICNVNDMTITNCLFTGNFADYGGGIYNVSTLSVTNCTIADNETLDSEYGNGAGIVNYSSLTIDNSIIIDSIINEYGTISGSNNLSSFEYWDDGTNNLVYDPDTSLFVDAENGDYHLVAGSQLINNGNNALAVDGEGVALIYDLDGCTRIVNGTVDIGAYEYQGEGGEEPEFDFTVVTTLDDVVDPDDDVLSLREAIEYASEYVTITFADELEGTIVLTLGQLYIDNALVIDGDERITIDANQQSRVFCVSAGTEDQPVVLNGLTIQNGYVEDGDGGGIYIEDGVVTVSNCIITGNTASIGGGIGNYTEECSSILTLTSCVITNNNATLSGGGVANFSDDYVSVLTITGCYFSANSSDYYGGGVYNEGSLTVTNSTISENTTSDSYSSGGGIYNNSGTLTVTNSTISGNTVKYDGGGIYNSSGILTVTNSTISGNTSEYDCGGGIYNSSGTLMVTNCEISRNTNTGIYVDDGICTVTSSIISENSTDYSGGGFYCWEDAELTISNCVIAGNSAGQGGGVYSKGTTNVINCTVAGNAGNFDGGIVYSEGTLTVRNSIVSSNFSLDGTTNIECFTNIWSSGIETSHHNLIGYYGLFVEDPVFDSEGNLMNAETMDLHLRSDSRAIDAGDDSVASGLTTDIEGNARFYGSSVDIGALEYQGNRDDDSIPYSTVVDTLEDSFDLSDCKWSLREALYYAPEYVTITFAPELKGTITLTQGQLKIDKALVIDGDGRITIDGDQKSTVIIVDAGPSETPVKLNGLTIQNGNDKGGLYNSGSLVITNSKISENHGTGAGGLRNYGTLVIANSEISGNSADYYGGGICNDGTLTVTNSTISGNTAEEGGGIYSWGTLSVVNSTIAGNSASNGAGIYVESEITVNNSIVSGNYSTDLYGDISSSSSNNLIGGNPNFITAPEFDNNGRLLNADTMDLHLQIDSAAIDSGNNSLAVDADGAALIYDLDGRTRIVNGTVDIGAYEYSCKVIQTSIVTAQENSPLAISEWEMFNVELRSIGDVVSTQTVSLTWNSSLFDLDTDLSVGENGVSLTFGEAVTENGITTQEVVLNVENPTILKEGALLAGLKFLPVASNSIVAGESAIWTVCVNNEALNVEVESFAFDLNDSGSVEINDLVAFARVFGQSSGESDLARIADFSGNGTVEINDLVLFARNFGKKRPSKSQAAPAPTALPAYASTPKLEEMPTVERGLVNDAAMTAYLDEME